MISNKRANSYIFLALRWSLLSSQRSLWPGCSLDGRDELANDVLLLHISPLLTQTQNTFTPLTQYSRMTNEIYRVNYACKIKMGVKMELSLDAS